MLKHKPGTVEKNSPIVGPSTGAIALASRKSMFETYS